ncbi:ATP synthase D chain, mitochondrial [Zea mays]|uniref:Scarecrow-like protein 28 n=1 Tax=Zea mays TaxID=4577 RepID=A0A1D6NWE2_MAIZE|nr:ATP synthase D chain, mitochondrial [Zea mays]AQL02432.1 Scarecrow-like protein 28 [Zea mays]|eukprot:NP_001308989.1 ATP synthase D chain, mitochondrial [Zea mays]
MLAGCSFSSSRHQMSTAQRFDILPYGFSKRASNRGDGSGAAPRVAAPDARSGGGGGTCSFRAHPAPPVTQAVSWGAKPEPGGNGAAWERSRAVKRAHEEDAGEEYGGPVVRAKRTRMGGDGDKVWFHRSIAGTVQAAGSGDGHEAEEEKAFLVPSAAAFPHGMSAAAAGPSLAVAKKEEFSKSPSNSPASSGGTDGGSSAVPWPEQLHAQNGAAARVEAMELVVALTACADSVAACNHDAANYYLARLGEMASPAGPTPMHRVAAYFAEALTLRVVRMWPQVFDVSPPRELTDGAVAADDDATALRVLNAVTPIPRFLHFTLNERVLRAFDGHDRVHVIDFDIKQGLQWPGLLQSLATRVAPPAHVRITGVGESRQELQETGARLGRVAAALGLAFEFHAVVDRLEDVRLWMLHVKRGECVAVNCVLAAHRLLRDETGAAVADFLGLTRSTGAAILLLGEHEDALNSGRWEARFARALRYYAAAFDAVEAAGLADASPARAKAEEMFAREIRNAVAFEAADRFERHETFTGWRQRMQEGGFQNAGIGDREALQGRMIARMFAPGNYSVQVQGDGEGLTLRWMDQAMYTVSAWTPVSDGGSTVSASVSTTASHSQHS